MAAYSPTENPWRQILDQALAELAEAEHAFEWADPDYSDYHAYRIQAAQEKVALILRQARQAYGIEVSMALPSANATLKALTAEAPTAVPMFRRSRD
ncbi:MAG: hypothetical protein OWU33_07365 [Firmicutes bacterium]|jgi:hypothetical protein|nr:hypothetical protein [Bacillota bacterium]